MVTSEQLRAAFGFEDWTRSKDDINALKDAANRFDRLLDDRGFGPPDDQVEDDDIEPMEEQYPSEEMPLLTPAMMAPATPAQLQSQPSSVPPPLDQPDNRTTFNLFLDNGNFLYHHRLTRHKLRQSTSTSTVQHTSTSYTNSRSFTDMALCLSRRREELDQGLQLRKELEHSELNNSHNNQLNYQLLLQMYSNFLMDNKAPSRT